MSQPTCAPWCRNQHQVNGDCLSEVERLRASHLSPIPRDAGGEHANTDIYTYRDPDGRVFTGISPTNYFGQRVDGKYDADALQELIEKLTQRVTLMRTGNAT